MSCNGCRVLRKGCSDSCVLRPCLQWIDGAEAQGHATVFVAKFFGRAGLMGFINAVPDTQRPALFQSLLYEACGRTVNPVFGAVGLLYSGNWHICQAAVEAVLKGGSLQPINHPNPKTSAKSGAAKAMASVPVAFNVVNLGHSQARELFMPPQANQASGKGCEGNANLGSTDVQNLVQAQSGVQVTSDPRTALYWQRWSANGASTDNGVKGHDHINRKREGAEINNVAKKAHTEDSPNHMLTPDAPKVSEEGDSVCLRTQVPQLADEQEAEPSKENKVDLDLSLAPHANSQQEQQLQQGEQVQQDQPQQQPQPQPQQHQLEHEEQQQDKVVRNASSPCRSMCSEGSVTSLDTNATDLTILAGGTNIAC